MTFEQLKKAKKDAYDAADESGVAYAPHAVDRLISDIETNLQAARLNATRHPKASSMLEDIKAGRGSSPTLTQLDQLRQVVSRDVASAADKAEKFMGKRIVAQIDKFIDNAGPNDVVSGTADDAANLIKTARDLNTRYRKVEEVQTAVKTAKTRAGSTGSGGNEDNAIRQNLRRVMEKGQNFTADEAAALEQVVMGGKGQNLLRLVGRLSPTNGPVAALGSLGLAAGTGGLGAIPGVAGIVSKLAADGLTRGKVADLVRLMTEGGTKRPPPTTPLLTVGRTKNLFRDAAIPAGGALALSATPAMARERR